MRRPGYLIAAAVLALLAAGLWFLVLSPGWIARTGWEAGVVEAPAED